jgi:predicted secreted Zn-dependent protease
MLASGPKDEKGTARFAYTAWTVRWQWPKGPDVAQTRIECSARITLPKHATPENLSPALLAQWQGLVTRITAHEHRHVSHVEEGAPKILERLRRSAAHKTLTSKEANEIAHNVLLEIQEADRRYDRDTEHGKSEGTWGF